MPTRRTIAHRRPADAVIGAMYGAMLAGAELIATTPTGIELYRTPAGRYFRRDVDGAIHPMIAHDAANLASASEEEPSP